MVPMVQAQCAMCVTGLTSSQEGQQLARGYNHAILFLLVFPYTIILTFGLWWIRAQAQKRGLSLRALIVRWYQMRRFTPSENH